MRKIPTLFVRDWDGDPRYVTREVTPGCEWVMAGEGRATRKFDGTCVMFDGERWWARREVKAGKQAPAGFTEIEHDLETGKTVGWEPPSSRDSRSTCLMPMATSTPGRGLTSWSGQRSTAIRSRWIAIRWCRTASLSLRTCRSTSTDWVPGFGHTHGKGSSGTALTGGGRSSRSAIFERWSPETRRLGSVWSVHDCGDERAAAVDADD